MYTSANNIAWRHSEMVVSGGGIRDWRSTLRYIRRGRTGKEEG